GIPKSMGLSNDGDYFWVGTRDGKLYRLSNMNQAQDSLSADITSDQCKIITTEVLNFAGRVVTSIAVDPQNNDHVIVTLGNYGNDEYVYRSTNATSDDPEFLSVQGNLPKMPIYSSLIEMKNSNIAMLGTEMGIFTTTNLNASQVVWIPQNGSMGEVTVVQLKQQLINIPSVTVPIDSINSETFPGTDNYGRIYAATFGRGIYKTNHFAIVGINELHGNSKKDIVRLNIYPNPAIQNVFIEYNITKSGQVKVNISDLSGRSVLQKDFRIINDNNVLQLDISNLNKGVYLISLDNGESVISNKLIIK
ncbi:MAG TPA: T9SS type A sorting domain-containing protein, partial [Bacteroidales bacterium]|nr:T9SS type A sorting domain-containing protein [Bacteroidales bacterium]